MISKTIYSSRSEEWSTPQNFFDKLNTEFGPFDLDPCATSENAKCPKFFTIADDGLKQEWTGRVFMNPPYGKEIGRWMEKARKSVREGATIMVCLVHARTDTRWWHENVEGMAEVRFVKGRLKFGGSKNSAPFPSAVVIYRIHNEAGLMAGMA